ncbi:hypothetical protein [Shimia sp. SK013]|uniref:hypothetical protein n=1 Tax=Shimia sp. SK013 TaxID=1389006 RepID=UPI0019D352A5|nr:hypothetical protein [Shimia sp. SK013]
MHSKLPKRLSVKIERQELFSELVFIAFIVFLSLALWWALVLFPLIWRARVSDRRHAQAMSALIVSFTAVALAYLAGPANALLVALFPPVAALFVLDVVNAFELVPKSAAFFFLGFTGPLALAIIVARMFRERLSSTSTTLLLCGAVYVGTHIGLVTANRPYQAFLFDRATEAQATCINLNALHGVLPAVFGFETDRLHAFIVADGQTKYWSFREDQFIPYPPNSHREIGENTSCLDFSETKAPFRTFPKLF